ncbi:hypothetical protein K431DRAFT_280405 [Polychaeton citri CBS 116435]|uniref:Uncharacterized protein n=1 Tax=Polychaeton citri CBS 116435 TaxID=1314669 RepID=A0A9P4UV12_9PEZI|nr:hypothetical protein K431DRAFT_280405 [Polychaeton citri CBS 116435]
MASLISLFNRLLPFATPGTPLVQDLVHLASICTLLYFAPQIQEWVQQRQQQQEQEDDEYLENPEEPQQDHQPNGVEPQMIGDEAETNQQANDDQLPPPIDPQPQPGDVNAIEEGEPGPADRPHQTIAAQRNVGAKKAKSLARKDQRRAYHEFQRSQGEAQRARDAAGAAEREAALAQERARRKAREDAIAAERAREREQRRVAESAEREEDNRRRELVVEIVREGLASNRMVDLFKVARQVGGDVDEEWVERIIKASAGLLGRKGNVFTMITSTGWAVRVREDDMREFYARALTATEGQKEGKTLEELTLLLKGILSDTPS